MRKLILLGLVFMLALSVLGCTVTDDIITDDQGNPDEVETSDLDESDDMEESDDVEESDEYDIISCYIIGYDAENNVLSYDQLEWISSTDTERIEELDLDAEFDFPNGFYIYNEDEDIATMKVSDTVKVYLVNLEDSFDPFLTDMDGLLERQAEYQAPYNLKFAGDVIHIIEEQFIP